MWNKSSEGSHVDNSCFDTKLNSGFYTSLQDAVNLFCIIQELGKSWEVVCAYAKETRFCTAT